jgi:hypothetical protein
VVEADVDGAGFALDFSQFHSFTVAFLRTARTGVCRRMWLASSVAANLWCGGVCGRTASAIADGDVDVFMKDPPQSGLAAFLIVTRGGVIVRKEIGAIGEAGKQSMRF